MTFSTFLLATLGTAVVFILVRLFWEIILIAGAILYIIGSLLLYSFITALVWVIFISHTSQGWGWLWLYIFIAYSAIVGIYAIIAMDIYEKIVDGVRNFIKSTR